MKVTEKPVKLLLPSSQGRGVGVHASAIIRCIATEAGILRPEWAEELSLVDVREIIDPVAVLRMSIGLAWEEWYIPNILGPEGVIDHPGEIHVDGIYMNPDGESVSTIFGGSPKDLKFHKIPVLHEVKATYKSISTVGDMTSKSQWMWRTQIMAYCYAKKTHLAEMHVLFLCGDYSYPIRPQVKRFRLEFTQQELDHNWALLTEYKEYHQGLESRNDK